MSIVVAFVVILGAATVETLPIDEALAAYEAALSKLRETEAEVDAEIGAVGPVQAAWQTTGMSAEAALSAEAGSAAEHVLGEWEVGGHGVAIPGDRPFGVTEQLRRYSVRTYEGPVDYHTYHRAAPGIVFHSFGTVRKTGNAECQSTQGLEIISRSDWTEWPAETAVRVFSAARMTRDDRRTYCIIYKSVALGRYAQLAFTPGGQPYTAVNAVPQIFVATPRADANSRLFN